MMYAVEMNSGGMLYMKSFMIISTVVQAILGFCFRNLRGCNVGITSGRDL
jgi:hypothetical protein